VCMCVCM